MPLTLVRDGAAAIVNLKSVFDRLPADADIPELLVRVIRQRETVPVIFRDGSRGAIASLNPALPHERRLALPAPEPAQLDLPIPTRRREGHRYEATGTLNFVVPVTVSVWAKDPGEASEMADDILGGVRTPHPDEGVKVDPECLSEIAGHLKAGTPHLLDCYHYEVIDVTSGD